MTDEISVNNPTRAGVEFFTWRTNPNMAVSSQHNEAYVPAFNAVLRGEAVGHASMRLTIINNEKNRRMVDEYLANTGIPYVYKHYTTGDKYQEDVIEIYFSWWPSNTDEKDKRFNTYDQDCNAERKNTPVPLKKEFETEKREIQGYTGSHEITLAPGMIQQFSSTDKNEIYFATCYRKLSKVEDNLSELLSLKKILGNQNVSTLDFNLKTVAPIEEYFTQFENPQALKKMSKPELEKVVDAKINEIRQEKLSAQFDLLKAMIELYDEDELAVLKKNIETKKKDDLVWQILDSVINNNTFNDLNNEEKVRFEQYMQQHDPQNIPELNRKKSDDIISRIYQQKGIPPTNTVNFHLKNDVQDIPGLDPEEMLKKMQAIALSKNKYQFFST